MKKAFFIAIVLSVLTLTIWGEWWWLPLFLLPIWFCFYGIHLLPTTVKEKLQPIFKNRITGYVVTVAFAWLLVQVLRALVIEPYAVPSESMKPTILPGDKIIVNKIGYGATFYSHPDAKKPVKRLPHFCQPQANDIVAFHLPNADSVLQNNKNYYPLCRQLGRDSVISLFGEPLFQSINRRPVFLKRIVACPGDTFSISHGLCQVNGLGEQHANRRIFTCQVEKKNLNLVNQILIKQKETPLPDCATDYTIVFPLTSARFDALNKQLPENVVTKQLHPLNGRDPNVFPFSNRHYFNRDYMGPFIIPAKGKSLDINAENIAFYRHLMQHEKVATKPLDAIWERDKSYTYSWVPKQDYFWVMGDNRHKSLDSRYWGFLPKDHIIGKAVRVWWSANPNTSGLKRYRTERFGKAIYN